MGYGDCACYTSRRCASKNDYEDLIIDAIDERSGANERERDMKNLEEIAETIMRTNDLMKVEGWC
jgi:hypothetical protein